MTCDHCAATVKQALRLSPAQPTADVSYADATACVETASITPAAALLARCAPRATARMWAKACAAARRPRARPYSASPSSQWRQARRRRRSKRISCARAGVFRHAQLYQTDCGQKYRTPARCTGVGGRRRRDHPDCRAGYSQPYDGRRSGRATVPLLTMAEWLQRCAQTFTKGVGQLSCCDG